MGSRSLLGRNASRKKGQPAGSECAPPWRWVPGTSDQDQGPRLDLQFVNSCQSGTHDTGCQDALIGGLHFLWFFYLLLPLDFSISDFFFFGKDLI